MEVISHMTEGDAVNETFRYSTTPNGCLQLGYTAVLDGGSIHVGLGDTRLINEGALVKNEQEARAYISALNRAHRACERNANIPEKVWSRGECKRAIENVMEWAKKDVGPDCTLSHLGIRAHMPVVASGRAVRLGFRAWAERSVAFYAYEASTVSRVYNDHAKWELPEYDPSVIKDLIAEVTGADPIDSWNEGRSLIYSAEVHPTVRACFQSGGVRAPEMPGGWNR